MHNSDLWRTYRPQLEELSKRKVNYDLERVHEYTVQNGWNIDSYTAELPPESPGAPEQGGPWKIAQDVLINYEFPDPNILTGFFSPDDDLLQRVMLLKAKFWWFTFEFGVRISRVIDEVRQTENGPARVWGYSYQTLEGHWEMGEITFEIFKYEQSGSVEFHINAYSKTGHIPNIFYRIGFAIFGRNLQVKFSKRALERMQELVELRTMQSQAI